MEVYQVRVFLEVARHLSFTEAADTLNLTQPAVSAKIKSLESELGTPLFYRLGRKIQLTEVGEFLLAEAPKLIQVENQLLQKVEEIKKGKFGNLKIGCTVAIANSWLPQVIFEYRQQHPGIQTQCLVFDSAELLYRAIAGEQIDLGISELSFADFAEISATAVDAIDYSLFVATNHPLAQQGWSSLQELKKYPWAILAADSPSRLMFESRLAEIGLSLADFPRLEIVDTISLMRAYILQGNYLGFASNFDFKSECDAGMLVSIPLQEFALSGNIYLLSLKRLSLSYAASYDRSNPRSRSLNPSQKFIALIQSLSQQKSQPPTRLRSPSFNLRTANSSRPETLNLSIGVQNGTIPAITAGLLVQRLNLLEHFLPKDGRYSATRYQINWCDFPTGAPIVEGLHSGKLDIGILGDYPLLLSAASADSANARKTRLVSFVSIDPDGSCSAVIVPNQSQIQSIEDLRGGAIAVPFGSAAHGMVMRSLNSANLLNEVKLTSLEHANPTQLFSFPPHLADGYAHFAPFHEIACRQGKFRYLSRGNWETLPAFYGVVVSSEIAQQYPEVAIAYLKAVAAAQHWYDTTSAAADLVSRWTQLETEIVAQILHSSHQHQPGRFLSEMTIRPDWLSLHIEHLTQIPTNANLLKIDLNRWIQSEFLQQLNT